MPDNEFHDPSLKSLDDLKIQTGASQATPSAMVLPARCLGMLNRDEADEHLTGPHSFVAS